MNNFLIPSIAISAMLLTACTPASDYQSIEGQTMGTTYHITFKGNAKDTITIQQAIDARLVEVNQSMSTYIKDSTISKFNRLPSNTPMMIDKDFMQVLNDSQQIFLASGGSFDPTVYPLVELWGFGSQMSIDRLQSPPTADEIALANSKVGLQKVILIGNELHKTHDGVGLDFSAIAKGYGVDVIADVLANQYHIDDYMVEIGGEVATKGVNAKGKAWTIAIDAPILDSSVQNREIFATLSLPTGLHIATSGGYRNSVEFDGVRYSHTINPATAQPVADGAPSVTVIHDSVALADGWATALTALSYHDALKIASQNQIKALFIIEKTDGKGYEMVKSDALTATAIKIGQ
ncbi:MULTISPECIES: FAD:protein FMN transferase [unclassified Moraxella]|uniref:FAD:protein FMN transferase n=1 Tax=unclassified Moraxella TaxID=2685852 RepID=UPI00359D54D5